MRWLAAQPIEEWEQRDDPRIAALIAGVNVLAFLVAQLLGLTDLIGVCLAASLLLLTAGYIVWERDRRRTAAALAVGTLPFWVLLAMVF
jgi:hypothetical protein